MKRKVKQVEHQQKPVFEKSPKSAGFCRFLWSFLRVTESCPSHVVTSRRWMGRQVKIRDREMAKLRKLLKLLKLQVPTCRDAEDWVCATLYQDDIPYTYIHIYIYTYIYIHILYIYTYTYIYTHTHVYIYISYIYIIYIYYLTKSIWHHQRKKTHAGTAGIVRIPNRWDHGHIDSIQAAQAAQSCRRRLPFFRLIEAI